MNNFETTKELNERLMCNKITAKFPEIKGFTVQFKITENRFIFTGLDVWQQSSLLQ